MPRAVTQPYKMPKKPPPSMRPPSNRRKKVPTGTVPRPGAVGGKRRPPVKVR